MSVPRRRFSRLESAVAGLDRPRTRGSQPRALTRTSYPTAFWKCAHRSNTPMPGRARPKSAVAVRSSRPTQRAAADIARCCAAR